VLQDDDLLEALEEAKSSLEPAEKHAVEISPSSSRAVVSQVEHLQRWHRDSLCRMGIMAQWR
jgi:hypothetical protein